METGSGVGETNASATRSSECLSEASGKRHVGSAHTNRAKLPVTAARSHSEPDDSSETDPGSDEDFDSEEIGPGSEGGLPADIAELFKKRVDDYLKSKRRVTQPSAPTGTSQTAKVTKKSTNTKSQTATTSSKKITTVAVTQVHSERAKPPAVTKPRPRPVPRKNLEKEKAKVTSSTHYNSRSPPPPPLPSSPPPFPRPSFSFSPQDIPDTCPNEDCEDLVPSPPSPQLIHMFRSLAEHIHKEGEYGRTVLCITLHICSDIASDNQLSELRQQVAECGWPVSVNFIDLNNFTWSLTADVAKILSDHSARASHIVWTTLLDRISRHYRNKGVTEEEFLLAFARDKGLYEVVKLAERHAHGETRWYANQYVRYEQDEVYTPQ
ncbi:hypothetical protein DEU56DRAFT_756584 [Suillus clintonianus]|uniref:uncharacterized protein n=1 Tax=Suillus clintonianus TaxID=1904413 RepID=UPI001B861286|nr:uncharacterized protein DEU56DRAFT_756584 [Suillus clintonianus]KAG2135447.1 hypothetical protein DEU56DRAFT_756584 [Suillus clintonianus]